ncbi:hypothetical protein MUN78_06885 [Leucobacter allii]|uniref:Uncharacterized protein n=1 Tax=Leucobacter allii TaxID=2932247 RepID=A0ABY4FQH5_9MICO|nr:hypothetical protein [Leucobacter allii]UOQ58541.1 hypothetical protein MUN78_06885 [Leucobacter allii]
MLRATIRQIETTTTEVKGEGLEDVREQLENQRPAGFALISAPVSMAKGETAITATGTYARRDGLQEITGETMAELRALVPAGWQMLSVIRD